MGIAKRPKLATSYSGPRAGEREQVSFDAQCSVASGAEFPVAVLDLDTRGCRVRGINSAVTKNQQVALRLGSTTVTARLRWLKRGSAGLAFDEPLDEATLVAARAGQTDKSTSRVVPLRRPPTGGGQSSST
ncbi:hypothetical protein A6F68_00216 [Tsuneonella dongtanensis]|uniref:PilZ domain-containing protein n=1 Tax=Tsuneonella dongtanensis TaxID=692370 RepID=A0A1B2A9G7_9SPHN|nr:hypothetical protein [Tsuneonella dongtanensis]ANY18751.1 hypothetical protein A6F68_00216 [Tsuneonella dongtanensis]